MHLSLCRPLSVYMREVRLEVAISYSSSCIWQQIQHNGLGSVATLQACQLLDSAGRLQLKCSAHLLDMFYKKITLIIFLFHGNQLLKSYCLRIWSFCSRYKHSIWVLKYISSAWETDSFARPFICLSIHDCIAVMLLVSLVFR